METQEIVKETNGTQTKKECEFTWLDVENLYNSAVEIQKKAVRKLDGVEINSLPLDLDLALAKFISKLKKWVQPFIECKNKIAEEQGFLVSANTYTPESKFTEEQRESNFKKLMKELKQENEKEFDHINELKELLPIKIFTEARIKESQVYFKDCPNRQSFLEHCIKQPDQP